MPSILNKKTLSSITEIFNETIINANDACCSQFWNNSSVHAAKIKKIIDDLSNANTVAKLADLLIQITESACQANDNRFFSSLRVYTNPFADCLFQIRNTILENVNARDKAQLDINADAHYQTALRLNDEAKTIRQRYRERNQRRFEEDLDRQGENMDELARGQVGVVDIYSSEIGKFFTRAQTIYNDRNPTKQQFQELLKQCDRNYRCAWALGCGTHKDQIAVVISNYGINQSEQFTPHGHWWNLTSN